MAFVNEMRFFSLSHKNINPTLAYMKQRDFIYEGKKMKASCIFSEYSRFKDFYELIFKFKIHRDIKLIRTFFRQLISGIEFLHKNQIAHMDLKAENLILGEDFNLKIIDFDLSYIKGDIRYFGRGTKNNRGPELKYETCRDPFKSDIYSAGIILYLLFLGVYPLKEVELEKHCYDHKEKVEDRIKRWDILLTKRAQALEEEVRVLFQGMTKIDEGKRWTLEDIKNSEWYNLGVYEKWEIERKMKELGVIEKMIE